MTRRRDDSQEELLPLFVDVAPLVVPRSPAGVTIQERFEAFHAANLWVMEALERLTADYAARGRTRIGIKMLFEVLRWHYGRATVGDEFRLNNNFSSRYVRALVDAHPEWEGMFAMRELKAP